MLPCSPDWGNTRLRLPEAIRQWSGPLSVVGTDHRGLASWVSDRCWLLIRQAKLRMDRKTVDVIVAVKSEK